jgi:glycosyltransferase involved in cell wall biosynthesis
VNTLDALPVPLPSEPLTARDARYPVSVVINTYNAAAFLENCLEAVAPYCEEIIVCDMHSTDATREIAERFQCRILMHEYMGMAEPARNFAVSHATQPWVLVVDADEMVPLSLWHALGAYSRREDAAAAVRVPRKNLFFGRWMTHTYPDGQIRFFRQGHVSWENKVHTHPHVMGSLEDMCATLSHEAALLHHSYVSIDDFVEKMNRYTRFEVDKLSLPLKPFSLLRVLLKSLNAFWKTFVKQGAYRDGSHGLVVSLLMGMYALLVQLKAWDARRIRGHQP